MKKRILSLLLSIITILTLFPIQLAFAGENGTGGGQGETGLKGNWDGSYQGFRISIVDQEGNLRAKPLDILYANPTATSSNMKYYWTVKTEPFESRTTANQPYMIDDLLKALGKSSQKKNIRPMLTSPYQGQGKNVRNFFSKEGQDQLYKVINWKPDGTTYAFTFYDEAGVDYIEAETPNDIAKANNWKILVENILWMNPRSRITGKHYSYWIYGTVSNINQWANKQRNESGDGAFSVWGKTYSGEGDVFFRYHGITNDVGPHALELDHPEEFEGYPTILMPGLYDNQYVPFDTSDIPECASDPFHGYGVQIYSAEPT